MGDVAILHDVGFAFGAHAAGGLDGGFGLVFHEVFEVVDFGANEAFFEVGVDDARGLGSGGAYGDGPGADFHGAGGEIALLAEDFVGFACQVIEGGLVEAVVGEHGGAIFGREFGEFGFEFSADNHDDAVFGFGAIEDFLDERAFAEGIGFVNVGDVEDFLGGHEAEGFDEFDFFGFEIGEHGADGDAFLQVADDGFDDGDEDEGIFVASAGQLAELVDAFFGGFEVSEDEFGVDGVDVAEGIDTAFNVGNVAALEAADDVEDGVDFADMGEELVAEAFALGGAADDAGDIDDAEQRGDEFVGGDADADFFEAVVRDGDDADVGLDGGEGVIGGERTGVGERVKDGGFADVGQTNDSDFHARCLRAKAKIREYTKEAGVRRRSRVEWCPC